MAKKRPEPSIPGEPSAENFGIRLRKARDEIGMSQPEVAERLKVAQARVSEWERGTVVPRATAVIAMIVTLGYDPLTIFPEATPKKKNRRISRKTID